MKLVALLMCLLMATVSAKMNRKIVSDFRCVGRRQERVIVQLGDVNCDTSNTHHIEDTSIGVAEECVSVRHHGPYNVTVADGHSTKTTNVQYIRLLKLPMYKLSESFVQDLLTTKYIYLNLVYRFQSSNYYLPKVSKLFRGLMDKSINLLDKVSNYILAKQVTTSFLDGVSSPDYACVFLKNGFQTNLDVSYYCHTNVTCLKSSLHSAYKQQELLIKTLTTIINLAHELDDHEMIEFLTVEILPEVTKTMKSLTNQRNTLKRMAQGKNKALAEFLFDKMLE